LHEFFETAGFHIHDHDGQANARFAQGDALVGPWLPDPGQPGKKRRAHLFCFIDDHSRLVPYAEFFYDEALPGIALLDRDGRFAIANGERIRLSIVIDKAPGKHLLESRLSEDQTHTETDTSYHITATVVQTLLLDRWLLSFGGQIRDVQKTAVGA
jgi:hypothetical protein